MDTYVSTSNGCERRPVVRGHTDKKDGRRVTVKLGDGYVDMDHEAATALLEALEAQLSHQGADAWPAAATATIGPVPTTTGTDARPT